jgi:hypothetical protein
MHMKLRRSLQNAKPNQLRTVIAAVPEINTVKTNTTKVVATKTVWQL